MDSSGFYSFDIRKYWELSPKDYIHFERVSLRQCLLYFDKLIFDFRTFENRLDYLSGFAKTFNQENDLNQLKSEVEYLNKQGLLSGYNVNKVEKDTENSNLITQLEKLGDKFQLTVLEMEKHKSGTGNDKTFLKTVIENQLYYGLYDELKCRIAASEIRRRDNIQVCPIIYSMADSFKKWIEKEKVETGFIGIPNETSPITSVVLKKFPMPSTEVSIEQIVEFKSDTDTRFKLLGLRNWVTDIGKDSLTINEISDKLEYTLEDYKKHLAIHKLKTNLSTFEIYTIATAEIIENIIKLQLGKAIKNILSLKTKEVELFEGELSLNGKELAYLTKLEQFNTST